MKEQNRGIWKRPGFSMPDNLMFFAKWTLIACVIGGIGGMVGALFGHAIRIAAQLFAAYDWILYGLPVAGVLIVFLYHLFHEEKNRGTNMVLDSISANEQVTPATGLLIFVGAVLTHLTGGSAGREGAALQLGGTIGSLVGQTLRLDEKDKKLAVMCGMSACFSALFGTPLAAAIFSMEVISVGILYYAALVPCLFSSLVGMGIAGLMGLSGERFLLPEIPNWSASCGSDSNSGHFMRIGQRAFLYGSS